MFNRPKSKNRPDDRYSLLEVIGEGGMGVVWKAFDRKLGTHVAVKTLLDAFDREAFVRFQGECEKLAGLPYHPNIVGIKDVGQLREDGREKPFLVMPLLEGATLAQLLHRTSISKQRLELLLSKKSALADFLSGPEERLSGARIVEIVSQVCKGLQVAHEAGIIHRDIKPSNIFVLSDFSAQIIDFGVAQRANRNTNTVGWKGTLLYMSPEQVQFRPLTTASDIFSLGVVCYEALVGELPFGDGDTTEVAERIVHHNPPVPHEFAPVTLPISQAVFKALAKQSNNRYLTVSAFADHLTRALALGEAELFPSPPRLPLAAEYHAKGNDEAALKTIEALSAEGISHPRIKELRERIDSSLRRKRIDEGIAAGRSLIEIREYDEASRELKRVLGEDPRNPTALSMLQDIDTRRTDDDVEELLQQARRHMEQYDFDAAGKALERVKKRRPREPRLSQFLAELDRIKAEYEELQDERERLHGAVRSAYGRRDISAARSSIQKLAALDAAHPNIPNPRASEFVSLRSQVETEQEAIDVALAEVNALVSEKRLQEAHEICSAQIAHYPTNEHFLHLQFQIEQSLRQAVADAIRETEALLRAEPDLMKQEKLLESKNLQFPGETHFKLQLERMKKLRAAVEEIASRARAYEGEKAFQEAQQEWQKLRTVYPDYPTLDAELERVVARRADQIKRQRKEKLAQQLHRQIDRREFQEALDTLAAASNEFQDDPELSALRALALSGIKMIEEAKALLREGAELCAAGNFDEGLNTLRRAYALDLATPAVTAGLVDGLLAYAKHTENIDSAATETSLREAVKVDPDHAGARHSLDSLVERRHDESIGACIAESLHRESLSDLTGAVEVIERGIHEYSAVPRLLDRRETLYKKLGRTPGPISYPSTNEVVNIAPPTLSEGVPVRMRLEDVTTKEADDSNPDGHETIALKDAPVRPAQRGKLVKTAQRRSSPWLISVCCGLAVAAAIGITAFFLLQPIRIEPALGVAVVQSSTVPLLKEPRPDSDSWMSLTKGQRVNILERPQNSHPLIRAQFVSAKVSRPGYVLKADLSEWHSPDITFAREVVRMSRPTEGASEEDKLRYAEDLVEFAHAFPKTPQADQAILEAAQILLEVASARRKAGALAAASESLIDRAEAALAGVRNPQSDVVAGLKHDIEELKTTELTHVPEPSAEDIQRNKRLKQLYDQAAQLYDKGGREEPKRLIQEILKIDPHYEQALLLKNQIDFLESLGK